MRTTPFSSVRSSSFLFVSVLWTVKGTESAARSRSLTVRHASGRRPAGRGRRGYNRLAPVPGSGFAGALLADTRVPAELFGRSNHVHSPADASPPPPRRTSRRRRAARARGRGLGDPGPGQRELLLDP